MTLKKEVLEKINKTGHRLQIASLMGVTEQAVKNYIERNDKKLTQFAPLQYIREVVGCDQIIELLNQKPQS